MTPLLKTHEAADLLQVHPDHLYRLVAREVVPAYRVGGSYRFRMEEVLDAVRYRPESSEGRPEGVTAMETLRGTRGASRTARAGRQGEGAIATLKSMRHTAAAS